MSGGLFTHILLRETGLEITRERVERLRVGHAAAYGRLAAAGSVKPLPGANPYAFLSAVTQPTLVLNGVHDIMIPTINSWHLSQNLPNAQLLIYSGAGHGAQFQYPERFLQHAIQFLEE